MKFLIFLCFTLLFIPVVGVAETILDLELDHIVYGVPDLSEATREFFKKTKVEPIPGGKHVNYGTHNALVALDSNTYLEFLAPDPSSPIKEVKIPTMVGLKKPRMIAWAVRSQDLEKTRERLLSLGLKVTEIENGSRVLENGKSLTWKVAGIEGFEKYGGMVPFIIQWTSEPHPSVTSPRGCKFSSLKLTHPQPDELNHLLEKLQLPYKATKANKPNISVVLETPKGKLNL